MPEEFLSEKLFFRAIRSYTLLLEAMTSIRAYSGATRLYMLTGMGVTFAAAGDIKLLEKNFAEDGILLMPPLQQIKNSISATCNTYASHLGKCILQRLDTRGTQDVARNNGSSPRLSYNISPMLCRQIDRLVDRRLAPRQLWGQETGFQNLADMIQTEYALVSSRKGVIQANQRNDETLRLLVSQIPTLFTVADVNNYLPVTFQLPVLKTLLYITRLLYADFKDDNNVPDMGPLCHRLWISDSTLAALPWPSPEFVKGFHESDAGMISSLGWRYLNHITAVYPDRFSKEI